MAKRTDEFEFCIEAYTPETIPMSRLAEYIADLANVLGETEHVHFVRLKEGSTGIVHRVEKEAIPKVRYRARLVNSPDAPPDLKESVDKLKKRLRSDNARGALLTDPDGEKIIEFRIPRNLQPEYPTVSEQGSIQGVVTRLGGSGAWVPVHLEDIDGRVYICEAKRDKTRELARYYLNGLIRVTGGGLWERLEDGGWELRNFRIHDFSLVADAPLSGSIERLREIPGKWQERSDPLAELHHIRNGRNS